MTYHQAHALRALGLLLADYVPTVGRGKTFLRVNRFFFTKTAIPRERKVQKLISRWEMNCLSEGYKQVFDHISLLRNFGCSFWYNAFLAKKNTF